MTSGIPNRDRREFIKNVLRTVPLSIASGPLAALALRSFKVEAATARLRARPNLSPSNILRFTAGLRPYRPSGIRIERETRFNKTLVHNYGHGGAGITLAWGSAEAAVDLIHGVSTRHRVAVLGAGVIGLSTAHELRARGYQVTMYAEKWHPHVTSSVAGGQWSPALVAIGESLREKALYQKILEHSFRKYKAFAGSRYGVRLRDNLIVDGSGDQLLTTHIHSLPKPYRMNKLPFENMPFENMPSGSVPSGNVPIENVPIGNVPIENVPIENVPIGNVPLGCNVYKSWLIEPPIYLPALTRRLRHQGVNFYTQSFDREDNEGMSSSAVRNLPESIVFNCMGLGAKRLIVDDEMIPIRGRLIHLKPDAKLDYLLLQKGYMFPRQDAVILGGTYDFNRSDLSFSSEQYGSILKLHRDFFGLSTTPPIAPMDVPYEPVAP